MFQIDKIKYDQQTITFYSKEEEVYTYKENYKRIKLDNFNDIMLDYNILSYFIKNNYRNIIAIYRNKNGFQFPFLFLKEIYNDKFYFSDSKKNKTISIFNNYKENVFFKQNKTTYFFNNNFEIIKAKYGFNKSLKLLDLNKKEIFYYYNSIDYKETSVRLNDYETEKINGTTRMLKTTKDDSYITKNYIYTRNSLFKNNENKNFLFNPPSCAEIYNNENKLIFEQRNFGVKKYRFKNKYITLRDKKTIEVIEYLLPQYCFYFNPINESFLFFSNESYLNYQKHIINFEKMKKGD